MSSEEWEAAAACRICSGQYFRSVTGSDRCENCESCLECGGAMPLETSQGYDSLCSSECAAALEERIHEAMSATAKVRRKQFSAANRLLIFERDGWICHLCSESVNPAAQWPHGQSPVLDHVIPHAKGGPDAPDNLKTAHARCNNRRKDMDLADYLALRPPASPELLASA